MLRNCQDGWQQMEEYFNFIRFIKSGVQCYMLYLVCIRLLWSIKLVQNLKIIFYFILHFTFIFNSQEAIYKKLNFDAPMVSWELINDKIERDNINITEYKVCQLLQICSILQDFFVFFLIFWKALLMSVKSLVHIINCSFLLGVFPKALKLSILRPVFKNNGIQQNLNNLFFLNSNLKK